MNYAIAQYPNTDAQEFIAWFTKKSDAERYAAVNNTDSYPLAVIEVTESE